MTVADLDTRLDQLDRDGFLRGHLVRARPIGYAGTFPLAS